MNDKDRHDIALFRYAIIAPLVSGSDDTIISNRSYFNRASLREHLAPNGELVSVSASTISRWYHKYKKEGFDSLIPARRLDYGLSRKIDGDIIAQIKHYRDNYPRVSASLIYQKIIENGTISKWDISLSTVTRYISKLKTQDAITSNKDMKRYERAHINEVWCGDSSVGPYIKVDGKKQKTYIICLIDDASRLITGIDIFFNDNYINLMGVIKSGVSKYGKPTMFNFDNGSPYKNKQMRLLEGRLGTKLIYCAPRNPVAKAKIERFFRTLKDQWMALLNMGDFNSLEELKASLLDYILTYNNRAHGSLNGSSPMQRFFSESETIKYISEDKIEEIFLIEIERKVSIDCVVKFDTTEYEIDYRYANQKIKIRHSPDLNKLYVVDCDGELIPLKLLNKHENSIIKREKPKLAKEDTSNELS